MPYKINKRMPQALRVALMNAAARAGNKALFRALSENAHKDGN